MTTAADVIAALNQRRQRKSLRPEVPGQLPPGWQGWLDAQPRIDGHAAGAPAPALVDALAQRPLRAIPRSPAMLGRWAALGSLLRQEWTPDLREERRLRIGVSVADIVLHTVLVGLLLWLMYLRFMALLQVPEEDEAVQVEFIGRGNVAEGGGALATAGAPSAEASAAPARRAPTPAPTSGRPEAAAIETMATPPPAQVVADTPVPARVREIAPPVAAEAAQPLQVTEVPTPQPEATFRLPPPRERTVALPQAVLRDVRPTQQVEDIPTAPVQQVRTLQAREAQAQVRVPELQAQPTALDVPQAQRMREIAARATPDVASRQAQVRVPEFRGELRDIPMPPGGSPTPAAQAGTGSAPAAAARADGAGGARGNAPVAGQSTSGSGAGERPGTQGGRGVAATGTGAGPALKPAPGGWPGAAKSDDWGASNRNVAGTGNGDGRQGDGLFNKDGSVRLPDEWSQQTGIDVDRAGTWLKRPGLEYRGTRFDQYWVPQGTLLQEWVRRGLKKVAIPIPGTRTRLECVVSLLQLGAGCYPVNPDVNEQPATARPPPPVPFKPGLQEDNGSLPPPPPTPAVPPAAGG